MSSLFAPYSNGDGTYNGTNMMADLTGLSRQEIKWTFERLRALMHVEGRTKAEALEIVKREGQTRPWGSA